MPEIAKIKAVNVDYGRVASSVDEVKDKNFISEPSIIESYLIEQDEKNNIVDGLINTKSYSSAVIENILSLKKEDLQKIVGTMSEEEYSSFIEGVEKYYDKQIEIMNDMLKGSNGEIGLEELYDKNKDKELKNRIDQIKQYIENAENNKKSAKYDYLLFLKDYSNYELTKFTKKDFDKLVSDSNVKEGNKNNYISSQSIDNNLYFSYSAYHEKHPNISPVEYVMILEEKYPDGGYIVTGIGSGIENFYEVQAMVKAFDVNPEFAKTYSFLYEKDEKIANNFFSDCKYELNSLRGQLQANEFLEQLKTNKDNPNALDIVANELGVTGEGLADGLNTFGHGVFYTFESLGTALGICEENRMTSVDEYRKMYILNALLSNEQKEETGLIFKDANGNYVNSDPNSLIDYTDNYSGIFLNRNYKISQGIGNMAPSMSLGVLFQPLGSIALGLSAGGNSYHGSMVEGKSYVQSILYGAASGATESITQLLLGGVFGLSDVNVDSFSSWIVAGAKEGREEVLQNGIDLLTRRIIFGEEIKLPETKEEFMKLLKEQADTFVDASITAGILNTPKLVSSLSNSNDPLFPGSSTISDNLLSLNTDIINEFNNSNLSIESLPNEPVEYLFDKDKKIDNSFVTESDTAIREIADGKVKEIVIPDSYGLITNINVDGEVLSLQQRQQIEIDDVYEEFQMSFDALDQLSPDYLRKSDIISKKLEAQIRLLDIIHSKGMTMDDYLKSCAFTPYLSVETQAIVDYYADDIVSRAHSVELAVSTVMMNLQDSKSKLVGFEHRFKSKESISRKISSSLYGDVSENQIKYYSDNINDSLRYTLILNENSYSDLVYEKLHQLISLGYDIIGINNAWGNSTYQGLNVTLLSPGDSNVQVELQFHTEDSFNTKEVLNHKLYEIQRSSYAGFDEISLATEIMKYNQLLNVKTIENMVGKTQYQIKKSALNFLTVKKYHSYQEYLDETITDRKNWKQQLTSEEISQIIAYIGENYTNSYKVLNGVLRGSCIDYTNRTITFYNTGGYPITYSFDDWENIYGETAIEFETRVRNCAMVLDGAIRKSPISEPMRIYRGVDYNALPEGIDINTPVNEIFTILGNLGYSDEGFMSATPVADGGFTYKNVILVMDCDVGTPMANLADFNSLEQEVLLSAGQQFSLTDVKKVDGKLYIYMRTNN